MFQCAKIYWVKMGWLQISAKSSAYQTYEEDPTGLIKSLEASKRNLINLLKMSQCNSLSGECIRHSKAFYEQLILYHTMWGTKWIYTYFIKFNLLKQLQIKMFKIKML